MDANLFWEDQLQKNKSGKPKYTVTIDPGDPYEEMFQSWFEKWRDQFSYFDNQGCGCCVNIYEFDISTQAVAELENEIEVSPYIPPVNSGPKSARVN
ncbi:hypothetical protein EON80_18450 [bacterium]|nr:MAG: hypothetical protein EON80_18450 [bacterium]